MSGVDEQQSDEFCCPDCGSANFESTVYGYRTIRINTENDAVLKGDWGNEERDGWECSECGHWISSDTSLNTKLYEMDGRTG